MENISAEVISALVFMCLGLTYLSLMSRAKIIGLVAMGFSIALVFIMIGTYELSPSIGLVATVFSALAVFNGYYALLGKD